jgi:hypothetical protein
MGRPTGRMERDFADPSIRWRVAAIEDQPIGYAKLSPLVAPAFGAATQGDGVATDLRAKTVARTRSRRGTHELGDRHNTC